MKTTSRDTGTATAAIAADDATTAVCSVMERGGVDGPPLPDRVGPEECPPSESAEPADVVASVGASVLPEKVVIPSFAKAPLNKNNQFPKLLSNARNELATFQRPCIYRAE